jgi:hypothetical protein
MFFFILNLKKRSRSNQFLLLLKGLVYILIALKGFVLNGINDVSFKLTAMIFNGLKFKFDGIEKKL